MALINCEECGRQVSDKAHACPHCGAPVDKAAPPEAQAGSTETASKKNKGDGGGKGCFGCLGLLVVLGIIGALISEDPASPGGSVSSSAGVSDHSTMAVVQCQNFVRDRLRSPSTADFPFLDHTVTALGNDTYAVRSYVDAQNGFGAMVRSHFVCQIRYTGGNDADQNNWTLVDLTMSR